MWMWMVAMVTCPGCNPTFAQTGIDPRTPVTLKAVGAVDGRMNISKLSSFKLLLLKCFFFFIDY